MSHDGLWCNACDRALPYFDQPHCPCCALPTPQGERCGHCLSNPPDFDHTIAAFSYDYPLNHLVKAMKYQEQLLLAQAFAERLRPRILTLPDYVIAMPLHPNKLRARGFNQSQLLANALANMLNLVSLPHACQRIRETASQSSLPWKDRMKNVRNAFRCDADLSGKRIVLVDDVLTTGASLNALAKEVRKRGAKEVMVWVVARTIQK